MAEAVLMVQATFDVRLLDSTYSVTPKRGAEGKDREEVNVRLYGKTRENQSITIICPDFKPYFFMYRPTDSLRKRLEEHDDVLSVADVQREYKGSREDFLQVCVRAPWLVPKFRTEFELQHRTLVVKNIPGEILEQVKADPEFTVTGDSLEARLTPTDRIYSQKLIRAHDLFQYMDREEVEKFEYKSVFFAADIVFTNRFIYDHDLETCIRVTGELVDDHGEYTTEIVLRAGQFEKCPIFTPKLKIMSFDIESSIKYGNIYCICFTVYNELDGTRENRQFVSKFGPRNDHLSPAEEAERNEDERQLLADFVREVRLLDPDVVTGYNINNFDFQMIYDRSNGLNPPPEGKKQQAGEAVNFGRDALGMSRRENRTTGFVTWDVKGRLLYAWQFHNAGSSPNLHFSEYGRTGV